MKNVNKNSSMEEALEIIYTANRLGVWLWIQNNTLKYKAPDNVDITEIILKLRQYKTDIIEILRSNEIFDESPKELIYKISVENCPLSFGQSALWFIEQYEEGTNAYHIPALFELSTGVDIEGVKYALNQIVKRHEVLRTTIVQNETNDQAFQKVNCEELTFSEKHLSDEFDYELEIKTDINKPFNLRKEYPVRVVFYFIKSFSKSEFDKTLLLINRHHIASDDWSDQIFEQELFSYYNAFINGDFTFSLSPLEIQYKDYSAWQRAYLKGDVLEKQLNYWKNKLSGFQNLEMPTDYVRPKEVDHRGESISFSIENGVAQKLHGLAKHNEVTLNTVMLASLYILLGRYSNQEDILIGTPIANRHHMQTANLIGFFVNTQANRVVLSGTQSFEELIQQIHQDQIWARLNQDLPFEKLVDELGIDRDSSRHPIFQVMFTMLSSHGGNINSEKEKKYFNLFQTENVFKVEKFDLSVIIDDSKEELSGQISYATSLFKKETITVFIKHYLELLKQIVEFPQRHYSEFCILNANENKQLVYDWNLTDKNYIKNKTICELFEEQVSKTPDSIALVYEGTNMTYKELNDKSNQLARFIKKSYLDKKGRELSADTIVAIYLDKSLEVVVSLLGVMKAGGAYVALDLSYPQERIDYILEDTKAELVLTRKYITSNDYSRLSADKIIYVDLNEDFYNFEDKTNLSEEIKVTDLAYVIYTSGSTGKPKGVMIEHKNLTNLVFLQKDQLFIDKNTKVLQYASLIFDASVWEIFSAILFGGQLFIMPADIRQDTLLMCEYIEKHGISLATLPPVVLSVLPLKKFSSLKTLVVAGESCPLGILEKWSEGRILINAYGPTEVTVCATMHKFTKGDLNTNIGKPVNNAKVYVFDKSNSPVPIGVIGELHVGGAGVARGYLNRTELTEERFIENPFVTESNGVNVYTRLYKTGDLVRWLPSGDIEFIGRNDNQVKIRGYRIEVGEVEQALFQLKYIKQACVIAKEKKSEKVKYLVAYYVLADQNHKIDQSEIIEQLALTLPDYMIPGVMVAMDSLPVTINGKIDKRALPDPELSLSPEDYVAPTNELEKIICKIWQDILGFERVGITDNFFRIGGDSILSIQVSSRIRQAGFICKVKDIFEYKTIAKLAEYLKKKNQDINIKTEQGVLKGELGLLPIQKWFLNQVEKGEIKEPNHWNQSFLIKVPELDIDKIQDCISMLVSYHDVLRIRYAKKKDENTDKIIWKQIYQSIIEQSAFNVLNVSNYSNTEIEEILNIWQGKLNLEQGPLFQIGYLYGYEDGSARICFIIHHMVVDGVSWRILAEDFKELYNGNKLPLKTSSYRQWISAVENYADHNPLEVTYWEDKLKDIPNYCYQEMLNEFSTEFVELNAELTKVLLQEISHAYHTDINDLLLTSLAYALKDINHHDIQGITLEGHGREDIDQSIDHSRTIGWFTTMFPVRLELKSNINESIKCIKEELRSIPNKGIGFGTFAACNECNFNYESLAPISFNYLGQFETHNSDWQITTGESGNDIHPDNNDHNAININGMVSKGNLGFTIVTKLGEDITFKLSDSFKSHLIKVIEHCKDKINKEGSSYTPSDFKAVTLSQSFLEKLESNARVHHNEIAYIYAATSLQQGFIYHALSQPEDDAYRVQQLFDYHEELDLNVYLKAWEACIVQYPILRTAFNWEEDILQIIYKKGKLNFQLHDISHISNQVERDIQIENIQIEDRKYGFDFTLPSLFRIHLIKQANNYYTVLKSEHHSIGDGWSSSILLASLHKYYYEILENKLIRINEETAYLETQDYINNHKNSAKEYWERILIGINGANDINALLSSPIDSKTYKKVELTRIVTSEIRGTLYDDIKKISQKEGITINSFFQFCWHKLIQVYSCSSQTIVGTIVSGRDLPIEGIEESIGLYVNTLPLIIDWEQDNTVLDVLSQIQMRISEMNTNSFVELAKLQKQGERLFNSMIVYFNYPEFNEDINGLKVSERNSIEKGDYPLSISANEQGDSIKLRLTYDAIYLTEERANHHLCTLKNIFHQLVSLIDKSHKQISLISQEEFNYFIHESQASEREYGKNKSIVSVFEEQVIKSPNNIAVSYDGNEFTYKQINEESNKFADYLISNYQLQKNELIGILQDRSEKMIISILGILKAGATYVCIDPEYPIERKKYIFEDAAIKVLITQTEYIFDLEFYSGKVFAIDVQLDSLERSNIHNKRNIEPENLAYVIYTSGTTGNPKGVMVNHRSILSLVCNNYIQLSKSDVFVFLSSPTFDASTFEIYTPLLNGNKLIIPKSVKDLISSATNFKSFLELHKISVLWLTKTLFDNLYFLDNSLYEHLNYLIIGGEALDKNVVNNLINSSFKPKHFLNGYGPTESTTFTCIGRLENEITSSNVPIGKPINNRKVYILDTNMNFVPIGVIGELYIGGAGLADGYLNLPELTAQKFVNNPFVSDSDNLKGYSKLYKTGDLVRWLTDGNIEFIGRNDNQVKIRGYRIELGEIENTLIQIEGINQAFVLVKEKKNELGNNKYLVAYYTIDKNNDRITQTVVRDRLVKALPDFMIPASFVVIDFFPLTANGKLDINALPDPEFNSLTDEYLAPVTELEITICEIWQEVLGIERVGVADDFFQLGGDSILSIRLVSKMMQFGFSITVRDIFQYKTIKNLILKKAEMDSIIHKNEAVFAYSEIYEVFSLVTEEQKNIIFEENKLDLEHIQDIYPASYLQSGMLFESIVNDSGGIYHDVISFTVNSEFIEIKFSEIWTKLINKHENLRSAFVLSEKGYFNVIYKTIDINYKIKVFENIYSLEQIVNEERKSDFDLGSAGVFRLLVLPSNSKHNFTLIFSLHHAITDGWSLASLTSEFADSYVFDKPINNDSLPPYGKFISNELRAMEDKNYKQFWIDYLSSYESKSNNLFVKNKSSISENRVLLHKKIGLDISDKVINFARELKVSPDIIFLGVYNLILSEYFNTNDLVIGTTVNNRLEEEGGDRVFGLHLNTIPIRFMTENKTPSTVKEYFLEVSKNKLNVIKFKEYPYGKIKSDLNTLENIYHCSFNYVHFHIADESINNQSMTEESSEARASIPLIFNVARDQNGFSLNLDGYANFIDNDIAESLIISLSLCLEQMITKSNGLISNYQLIDPSEYEKIIHKWNGEYRLLSSEMTIVDMFELKVKEVPNNIALISEGQELSYKTLNEKSNQLARDIRSSYSERMGRSLNADTPIVLFLDRGVEMIIGILAILKAGGAYVPIECNSPKERIEYICEDTATEIILSQRHIIANVKFNFSESKVIFVDLDEKLYKIKDSSNLARYSISSNLANIIYTSGTTGRPKGVMIEHRNVLSLICNDYINITSKDVFAFLSSTVFDAATFEIFSPLLNGNKLLIEKDLNSLFSNVEKFKIFLTSYSVSILWLTKTLFDNLYYLDNSLFEHLNYLIVGGEALDKNNVNKLISSAFKPKHFINGYGPTEGTTFTCTYNMINQISSQNVPIGKPINNRKIYVLSPKFQPVPVGVIGELYIGGAGVARGYLNRPDLTSERFIANHFATDKDKGYNRLYKTGDLARWLPDGNIEFIGRNDDQVKIRGYRIELGEIENALTQINGISQSCVVLKEKKNDSGIHHFLVGYYISDIDDSIDDTFILSRLSQVLPDYMVPSFLIRMESFPLTVNGKLDKKALPESVYLQFTDSYVGPTNEREEQVCEIWQQVLGIEKVGIHDNFFRIGGNSILAIQVSHRMSTILEGNVKVADIFKYKTITQLFTHCTGQTQINIPTTNINNTILSFAQERLWFIEQYEEGTNAYHIPSLYELDIDTDKEGIKYALQQIVSRHQVLRSTIEQIEGHAIQMVNDAPLLLEELTINCISDYESLVKEDIERPFDLSKEYPIRVKFYNIESSEDNILNKTFLLINTHHIASDGFSIDIFEKELYLYYESYINNDIAFSLPALEIQYKDYAVWQKTYLTGEVLEKQLSYWKNKLVNYQTLEFPTDFVRPIEIDYRGASHEFNLSKDVSLKLRSLAQANGVTLNSVMLSSVNILLSKYTGQNDILIGGVIANRHHQQTANLIGFFVNTQVNRTILNNSQSFEELINQVHQDQIGAQLYQDIPFEKIVDELGVERDTSRHPIFQILFGVQSFAHQNKASGHQKEHLKIFVQETEYETAKFDLSINIIDSEEELKGQINYATSLFKRETIEMLAENYIYALEQLLANPVKPYGQLSLLNPSMYSRIITEWNKTDKSYEEGKTIKLLVEEQVEKTPDKIALVFEGKVISYRELNDRSNQLARCITREYKSRTKRSLGPDTLIALYLERSVEMVIGILGVLKAGGTYVPIDSRYPKDRIDYILEDTESAIILSQRHLTKNSESKLPQEKVLNIDLSEALYKEEDKTNLVVTNQSKDLAYVIYTSGTTGNPKGVMISHQNLTNFLLGMNQLIPLTNKDHFLAITSISFDISILELLWNLTGGRTITIKPDNILLNNLDSLLNNNEEVIFNLDKASEKLNDISAIQITPSYLDTLLEDDKSISFIKSLKYIIVGGEKFSSELLHKLRSITTSQIYNMYGPTETTIWSTCHITKEGLPLSIGTPIQNTQVYILNSNIDPVPIGVIGELYIGGAGVARGYLNRPELTSERFIENPFSMDLDKEKGNTRLYKTGDLGKWLPDGNIEFIGRNDDQVKIRGYRIELGEIQHALTQINGISQSCVVVKEKKNDTGIHHFLVGYYISDNDDSIDDTFILSKLSQVLPDYMVPSFLIRMESFPLTVNGKLDKKALPESVGLQLSDSYVEPTNEIEVQVCEIWQQILGIEKIGIHDNFFRIGGNSILAIQLCFQINRKLACNLSVADVFRLKTVNSFCDKINSSNGLKFELLKPFYSEYNLDLPNLILIHGGFSGSEVYQNLSDTLSAKFNCIGIDNYNIHNDKKISTLSELANHYLSEYEKKYKITDSINLVGWSFGGTVSLEIAKILENRGYRDINVILLDTFIRDEFMIQSIGAIKKENLTEIYDKWFTKEIYETQYIQKVFSAMEVENKIASSKMDFNLKYTKIKLFKASQLEYSDANDENRTLSNYLRSLEMNNINKISKNIKLMNLDCNHYNILEIGNDSIRDYLISLNLKNGVTEKESI